MPDKPGAKRTTAQRQDALVWIDCEMTGLNPDTEGIIEIFCLITDGQLNLLDPCGWGTVVHQTKERMDMMDEWCTRTHGDSGLTSAVISSTVTPSQAADGLLAYIQQHIPEKRVALLAGNSVHADRAFLRKEPYRQVLDYLHYRILDVSSIKEAARRHYRGGPSQKRAAQGERRHILESIEEARFYKTAIFQAAKS
ncbi:Phosphatidylinositol 3,4,5-trisphosphate-dependent Rac exchanger 2 protein [Collariella sp. IMI 366227]|nr:Phosphatidylinositol 3,4,5-trisphosphate-dependent Rac exchanger 2 protein [Collariella sp. IMI 366227]